MYEYSYTCLINKHNIVYVRVRLHYVTKPCTSTLPIFRCWSFFFCAFFATFPHVLSSPIFCTTFSSTKTSTTFSLSLPAHPPAPVWCWRKSWTGDLGCGAGVCSGPPFKIWCCKSGWSAYFNFGAGGIAGNTCKLVRMY